MRSLFLRYLHKDDANHGPDLDVRIASMSLDAFFVTLDRLAAGLSRFEDVSLMILLSVSSALFSLLLVPVRCPSRIWDHHLHWLGRRVH